VADRSASHSSATQDMRGTRPIVRCTRAHMPTSSKLERVQRLQLVHEANR